MTNGKRKSKKKRLSRVLGVTFHRTRDEIVQEIDRKSRLLVGMSAEQMLQSYREGTLEDPGKVSHLLIYSDLLSKNDPVFGAPR